MEDSGIDGAVLDVDVDGEADDAHGRVQQRLAERRSGVPVPRQLSDPAAHRSLLRVFALSDSESLVYYSRRYVKESEEC